MAAPSRGGDSNFRGAENGVGHVRPTTSARPAHVASSRGTGATPVRRKRTTTSHGGAGGARRGGGGRGGGGGSAGSFSPGHKGPVLEHTAAAGLASASMAGRRAAAGGELREYHAASPATSREGGDGRALLRGVGGSDFLSAALYPGGHHADEALPLTAFDFTRNPCWSSSPSSQEEAGRGNDAEYRRQHQQAAAWAPSGSGGQRVDDARAMANGEARPATAAELAFCRARSSGNTHHIASSSYSAGSPPAVSAAVAAVSASMVSRERPLATAGPIFEASAAGESVRPSAAAASGIPQDRHPIFQQQLGKQPIMAAEFHSHAPAILSSPLQEPLFSASSSSSLYAAPVASTTMAAGFVEGGHGSLSELPSPSAVAAYPRGRPNLAWPHEAAHSGTESVSMGEFGFDSNPPTADSTPLRAIGSMALPEGANIGLGLDGDGSLGFGMVGHTGGGGDVGV